MRVDRKVFKSTVWEYFGWHKKAIGSCWVVCNIIVLVLERVEVSAIFCINSTCGLLVHVDE